MMTLNKGKQLGKTIVESYVKQVLSIAETFGHKPIKLV